MGHKNMEQRLVALFRASRRADGTIAKGWSPLTAEEVRLRGIESHRRWKAKNKRHILAYNKARSERRRLEKPRKPVMTEEERKRKRKEWLAMNKETVRAQHRAWRKKRLAYVKEKERAYHAQAHIKAKSLQRQLTEAFKKKRREYLNRPDVRARNRALALKRMKCYGRNPEVRLTNCLRTSINCALKRGGDVRSWREFIDYDIPALRAHLERQFKKGMTWENRGKEWHIDHIVPISELREDIRACWALTNLRPLWAKENLKKTNKRIFLV